MTKRVFEYGRVWNFGDLPANSIALDGAVQAPQVDAGNRKFSFDHHAGCVRLVTLSTCEQVMLAIELGLVVDAETSVYMNDLDADTVLALWLLENTDSVNEPRIRELVQRIGKIDAHGPIFPVHPLHPELQPAWGSKEPQSLEMLEGFLAKMRSFVDGTWQEPAARPGRPAKGFGWHPERGWVEVETENAFQDVYAAGFLAGVLYQEAPNGTLSYTVGKRSDLVPLAVGPGTSVRPPKSEEDYLPTIIGRLGLLERELNPEQSHEANWGGGSSIGGSPRNPNGSQSRLTPEQVLEVCKAISG